MPLDLGITALILKGNGMRRQSLAFNDLYPSSTVSCLLQKVQARLDDVPSEVQLLSEGSLLDFAPDSTTLSDCRVSSGSRLMVLAHYGTPGGCDVAMPDTAEESPSGAERPEATGDSPGGVGDLTPCLLVSAAPSAEETGSEPFPHRAPEPKALLPPLLLQRGLRERPASKCLWSEDEDRGIQEGRLFELWVGILIFVEQRTRVRNCALPVSAETKVAEVRARIEMWLGARAAELTLLSGSVLLEGEGTLGDYEVGRGTRVLALATF